MTAGNRTERYRLREEQGAAEGQGNAGRARAGRIRGERAQHKKDEVDFDSIKANGLSRIAGYQAYF